VGGRNALGRESAGSVFGDVFTSTHPRPLPFQGGEFVESATRLAGFSGAVLGWSPDAFWRATPAELAAVVLALAGGDDAALPPEAGVMAALKERYPDG
jgi:uncharacterized phage protein (TIGR02216 family)